MKILLADLETRSRIDLKAAGHRRYAADLSTNITVGAWTWKGRPDFVSGACFLPHLAHIASHTVEDFKNAVRMADRVVFHNAGFDANVLAETLNLEIPLEKLDCTMARAQRLSLPGGLDELCGRLGVLGKSPGGTALVMKTCKPGRDGTFCEDEGVFRDLLAYCIQDVRALVGVDARLPSLPPPERRIWERTWRKNEFGLPIDIELAQAIASRRGDIEIEVSRRLQRLTGGAVTAVTQRQRIHKWLASVGVSIPTLQKAAIEECLEEPDYCLDGYDVLTILADNGGMAPAKAQSLLNRAEKGHYKDHTRYFGARSGRGTSEGVNTFNIARPSGRYDIDAVINYVKFTDDIRAPVLKDDDDEKAIIGNLALTDALRGMICADPGQLIIDADLANIELRIALWLAGDTDRLKILANDGDLYMHNAIGILGLPSTATKKTHPNERQLIGKPLTLGGNYGLGHLKFYASQRRNIPGLDLDKARAWIEGYRRANPKIAGRGGIWSALDSAAREAFWNHGLAFGACDGKVGFCCGVQDPWTDGENKEPLGVVGVKLWLRLPSGRTLPHYWPQIDRDTGDFLFYRAKHGKMLPQKGYGGAWTEIICQSAARDVITGVESQIEEELPDVRLLMDVYDSVVCQAPAAVAPRRLEQIIELMRRPVKWAPGLPLNGEGYCGERMRK